MNGFYKDPKSKVLQQPANNQFGKKQQQNRGVTPNRNKEKRNVDKQAKAKKLSFKREH